MLTTVKLMNLHVLKPLTKKLSYRRFLDFEAKFEPYIIHKFI